jgi:hypothetical protein
MKRSFEHMGMSTTIILVGIAVTYFMLPKGGPGAIFSGAAIGMGIALGIATGVEACSGIRNLVRVDILMLWALYGLTLLEFLFPQPRVDILVSPEAAMSGTNAVLVGFAGLVVGRHLIPARNTGRQLTGSPDLSAGHIFWFFIASALLGYLHIFWAVSFDPYEVLRQMSLPRFSQAWSRGAIGDASALLNEVGALIYLIPPIGGLIWARLSEYSIIQRAIVTIVLLFTLYFGFASGTRNVFATYIITFGCVYFLGRAEVGLRHVLALGVPLLGILFFGTVYMLELRGVGLENYSFTEKADESSFFVDYNIINISRLTEVFPDTFDFLGLEIPFNAIIRPIPRALWSGKPIGLSVPIESALGVTGMTLSCTFIGEAYMAGGLVAVVAVSLLFGTLAEVWNRVGGNSDTQFALLLYVSGFLCAAIAMRSMLSMVPLILPTIALWLFGRLVLRRAKLLRVPPAANSNRL